MENIERDYKLEMVSIEKEKVSQVKNNEEEPVEPWVLKAIWTLTNLLVLREDNKEATGMFTILLGVRTVVKGE